MRTSKFTEEKIISILKQHEAGRPTAELCREVGISTATFYNWKAKYGGMEVSDAKHLRQMEDENRRLKQIVADLTLENQAIKGVLSKKW